VRGVLGALARSTRTPRSPRPRSRLEYGREQWHTETLGYGELDSGLGIDDDGSHVNALVSVAIRKGTSRELGKGSITVDARWRPTYERLLGKSWKFAPYVWFQWFAGYGETLGTYDSATNSLRLGIGLTDRTR
jgi:hypothetical protein